MSQSDPSGKTSPAWTDADERKFRTMLHCAARVIGSRAASERTKDVVSAAVADECQRRARLKKEPADVE